MKAIHIDLPADMDKLELHLFSDEHIGDRNSDLQKLKDRINKVATTPNAYCILNGDIIDNATKSSIGDIYEQTENPMEQLQRADELFVNTAANLKYGGYGERMAFKPSSSTQPVIILSGTTKFAKAVL